MTYTVVPDKSIGDIFSETMWDVSIKDNQNKGVLRCLQDQVLGSDVATVTFSSIATDWAHLMVQMYTRGSSITNLVLQHLRFNSDSGNNYDYCELVNTSGSVIGSGDGIGVNAGQIGQMTAAAGGGNLFASTYILIPNYANTSNHKAYIDLNAFKSGTSTGNLKISQTIGFWRSTSAISSITLLTAGGNYVAGSRFTLYGVAGV